MLSSQEETLDDLEQLYIKTDTNPIWNITFNVSIQSLDIQCRPTILSSQDETQPCPRA